VVRGSTTRRHLSVETEPQSLMTGMSGDERPLEHAGPSPPPGAYVIPEVPQVGVD
jgi:hypothetical protein